MNTPRLELQTLYRHRFSEAERRVKARTWEVIVRITLQAWIAPEDTLLDLGCGLGEFLNHARARRRIGVDLNPDNGASLSAGIEFHAGDVCDLSFLPSQSVDVAFTSNTLEHLPSKADVKRLLLEVRRVLKPGGAFIAMGPNLRFLPGAYWDFWDHVIPLTDRSLVELLRSVDFAIVDCRPKFLPYTTRSWLPQAPWLIGGYLRCPLLWRLLGRQFLVRARKTGSAHGLNRGTGCTRT